METGNEKVMRRRMEWLVPDQKMPKSILFGWLLQSWPKGGSRRRWRDVGRKDLKSIGVNTRTAMTFDYLEPLCGVI